MSNNYDYIAPFYDTLVRLIFGKSIWLAQEQWLTEISNAQHILFIGGGSGKCLKKLLKLNKSANICYLEPSGKMLRLLRQNLSKDEKRRIEFKSTKFEDFKSENQYDAIVTFFFLDLFQNPKRKIIFEKIDQLVEKRGKWLMSDFNQPKGIYQKLITKLMFIFLKISTRIEASTIEDYKILFEDAGYQLTAISTFHRNFIFSNCYQKA